MRSFIAAVIDGQQASTERGRPHVPILAAIVSDIMLAAVAGTLHHFAGNEVEVLAQKRGKAEVRKAALHQLTEESMHSRQLGVMGLGGEDVDDGFHAGEARGDFSQIENQLDADA